MAQDFRVEPRKPCITGIKWHCLMKHLEDKFEAETISLEYLFFQIFKIDPLSVLLNHNEPGPKGLMPHGKGLRKTK